MTKVFPDAPPPQGKPSWDLALARGERESFQLLILAGKAGLKNVSVRNVFRGKSGVEAELSLVGFVHTSAGDPRPWAKTEGAGRIGWWPDPLLPNRPFDVAPGETQPVWVTVYAPPGTAPGKYEGALQVNFGNGVERTAAYHVRVFPVDLPALQHFRNAAFMPPGNLSAHYEPAGGMNSPEFFELYKRWVRKAFSQHLGPTFDMMMGWNQESFRSPTTSGPLGPTKEMALGRENTHLVWPVLGNSGSYDFHLTDELAAIGREYGMRQFSIAIFNREETWEQHSEAMKAAMADYLKAYASHLRGLGLLDDAYVYNVDEPPEEQWDTVRNNYRFVKSVEPELKTWLCLNQPKAVRDLQRYTDILDVYIRQYKSSEVAQHLRPGKQLIWAVCVWPHEHPNLFIEYPGEDARVIGWLTYRYGISGFEYWGLNQWGQNTGHRDWANFRSGGTRTSWQATKFPWGDGWLLYPGDRGEPLSSVRFENLRDGFEDAEMLNVLANRGKKKEADALAASLAPAIESYSLDPAKFQAAHLRLLELLRTVQSSAHE
ncbi:MAG TPA: glycoside hydrolase domain-containing protein [Bryobacteraceae bacterium]|nr:glycoside hydrolase domain-containing protein [Bryobacteraceae bacterium]